MSARECQEVRIESSVVSRCTIGLSVDRTVNTRVAHVTLAGCSAAGILVRGSGRGEIRNSILVANNTSLVADSGSAPSWSSDRNVVHGTMGAWGPVPATYNAYEWCATSGLERHSEYVVPGFVDPVQFDLHIDPAVAWGGGLRVDAAGNVYVGLHGAPAGSPAAKDKRRTQGSVVKFGPKGGGYVKLRKGEAPPDEGIAWTGSRVGDFVRGGVAAYPLLAPQVAGGCVCKEARFDLDGWGRLYIPNGLDYYVRMVDNAGNEIARFGHYGSPDSHGPHSAVARPKIPLGWPISVSAAQAGKGRLYVADTLNRRVIRVDLEFAAEETCEVR